MSKLAQYNCPWPAEMHYEKIRSLGSGSYGGVWLARSNDPAYSKDFVAVKTINVSSKITEEYAIREIEILSQVNHPYCTKLIRSFDIINNTRFLVIELGKGPTIQYLLKTGGALGLPLAEHISRQLIEIVAYLHSHAIMHRDLKPDNCIVVGAHSSDDSIWSDENDAKMKVKEAQWKLMLVDFGFARSLSPEDLQIDYTSEAKEKNTIFSLDEAIDPKYSAYKTNEIGTKSISNRDILNLSCIGSRPFAAPEVTTSMKKNSTIIPFSSFHKLKNQKSFAEYVSDYSMAADAFSLGKIFSQSENYIITLTLHHFH